MSNKIKRIEKKYDLKVNGMPISNIEDTLIEYWHNNMSNYGGESFEIDIVGNRKWKRLLEVTECEYIDIANYEYDDYNDEEYEDDCEEGSDVAITLKGEGGWYESYDKDMLLRDALEDFITNLE